MCKKQLTYIEMKKLSKYCFIIFMLHLTCINAQRVGGGNIDTLAERMKIKVNYPLTRGESSLPSSHSLRIFAPPVQSQGSTPSCISWATAYAGMTIVKRIEKGTLQINPFSAMNLYNRVRPYDALYDCNAGSMFSSNIVLAKSKGVKFYEEYPEYCENLSSNLAYTNKLYNYEDLTITAWNIKYAIARNRPVMIGMKMYSGEYWGTMSYHETGIWDGTHTGNLEWNHGMLVIGYDDNIAGGAFLVMNSWGTDFGKDGFFWLKYKHVVNELVCAYAMIPSVDNSRFITGGNTRGGEALKSLPKITPLESVSDSVNPIPLTSTLTLQNRCGASVRVAIGQRGNATNYSKGWYVLAADADQQLSINAQDSLFLLVDADNMKLDNANYAFSINENMAFEYRTSTFRTQENFVLLGNSDENNPFIRVQCENALNPLIKVHLTKDCDTTSMEFRNIHWNGKDLLYDPITLNEIKPDSEGKYIVYLSGKKIKAKELSREKLLALDGTIKFGSKESAASYEK
jgi:hypothetical protein